MITKPTVLVLGAGASEPYGLPCGDDFRNRVLEALIQHTYDKNVWHDLGIDPKEREIVGRAFRESAQKSIDLFLIRRASHDRNKQRGARFLEIGKIAIAIVILESEVKHKLYFHFLKKEPNVKWYELLWERMDATPPEFGRNQMSVVTFNYDRSIEYSLFHRLRATYGIDDDREVDEILRKVWFYHVHGLLAYPDFNSDDENKDNLLPYGAPLNAANIKRAANNILLVGEQKETMERLERHGVWERLKNAEEVVFLGCGYAKENLDLLNIQSQWKVQYNNMGGTFRGMEYGERESVRLYFQQRGKPIWLPDYNDVLDVYTFIRKHHFLKSSPES